MKQSLAFEQQGQYRAAIIEVRKAKGQTPNDINLYIHEIQLYNQLGYYRSALQILNKLKQSKNTDLMLERAETLVAVKKYRSAETLLLTTDVEFDEVQDSYRLLYLGLAEAGQGKIEEAQTHLQKAAVGAAKFEALLAIARMEALEDDSAGAIKIVKNVLAEAPENTSALILAGEIANYHGRYSQAEDYFSQALAFLPTTDIMLPERLKTLQMLSRVLTMSNRSHEALVYKRILAKQNPEHVKKRDRIQQSINLIQKGELDEAETLLLDLLEEGGDPQAGTLLGIVNYIQGDLSEASSLLSTHMDPETASSQALEILVSAKFQLDEIDQVLAILGPEVQARTANAPLLGLYGLAMLAKKDMEGVKYVSRALELEPASSRLRLALVSFYHQLGKPELALEHARLAYTYDAANPMVQGALVQQLIENGYRLEAQQLAIEIADANPSDSKALTLAGLTYSRLEKNEKAILYLNRAVEIDPKNATAWLAMARIAFLQQDYSGAATHYRQAILLMPESIEAYQGFVSCYEAQGDVEPALKLLALFAELVKNNGISFAVLADYLLRNDDLANAEVSIVKALKRQANNSYIEQLATSIFSRSARVALSYKDIPAARKSLSTGLSYLPNSIPLLELLVKTEDIAENDEAARYTIDSLMHVSPASAYEIHGDIIRDKQAAAALELYLNGWAKQPSSQLAQKIYLLMHDVEPQRLNSFRRDWENRLPQDPGLQLAAATDANARGDSKAAITAYQALLQRIPNNVTALNNLAWLLLERNDPAALPLAQQAASLNPENPAILDTYAMALLATGQIAESIAWLEKASALAPESAQIKAHLEQAQRR